MSQSAVADGESQEQSMHWDFLPKVVHNKDAVREYERQESKRINRFVKRFVLIALPVILILAVWSLLR